MYNFSQDIWGTFKMKTTFKLMAFSYVVAASVTAHAEGLISDDNVFSQTDTGKIVGCVSKLTSRTVNDNRDNGIALEPMSQKRIKFVRGGDAGRIIVSKGSDFYVYTVRGGEITDVVRVKGHKNDYALIAAPDKSGRVGPVGCARLGLLDIEFSRPHSTDCSTLTRATTALQLDWDKETQGILLGELERTIDRVKASPEADRFVGDKETFEVRKEKLDVCKFTPRLKKAVVAKVQENEQVWKNRGVFTRDHVKQAPVREVQQPTGGTKPQ